MAYLWLTGATIAKMRLDISPHQAYRLQTTIRWHQRLLSQPYNQGWLSGWSVIGHNWFLNDQLWLTDYAVCLLHKQWQQCLKSKISVAGGDVKDISCLFFVQTCKMAVVSNLSILQKTLMVELYWNCCWNAAQKWFFKSSMSIKTLQCLPIFYMT